MKKLLLKFTLWLRAKHQSCSDYSRNDQEWIEVDNKANAIINQLRKQL